MFHPSITRSKKMILEHKIISIIVALLMLLGLGVVVNAIWGDKIFN